MQRKEYFGLSLSLILIVALLTFINSNFFTVNKIVVKGNNLLSSQQIIEFARLDQGENIFQIDFDQTSSRLMERPQIEGVILKRQFPSTVEVLVDEKEPLVSVKRDNNYLILDGEGWILAKPEKMSNITYPRLKGVKIKKDGNKVRLTRKLQVCFEYLTGIDEDLLDEVSKVQVKQNKHITFYLGSKVIEFGPPIKIDYKIKLLNQIYNDLKSKKKEFKYINLQYHDNPVIKLR